MMDMHSPPAKSFLSPTEQFQGSSLCWGRFDALSKLGSSRATVDLTEVVVTSNLRPILSVLLHNSLQDTKNSGTLAVPLWSTKHDGCCFDFDLR